MQRRIEATDWTGAYAALVRMNGDARRWRDHIAIGYMLMDPIECPSGGQGDDAHGTTDSDSCGEQP